MGLDDLTMSAITALRHVRLLMEESDLSSEQAFSAAPKTVHDLSHHDYERARALFPLIGHLTFEDLPHDLRAALDLMLISFPPAWYSAFAFGRERVIQLLPPNSVQLFRDAGLLVSRPNAQIVGWWDKWAAAARSRREERQTLSGRAAEERSLEFETLRLAAAGCPHVPRWIALDDAAAGYDIASFDLNDNVWVPCAIEVKSNASGRCQFYLSRNEYNTCVRLGDGYRVHVWLADGDHPRIVAGSDLIRFAPGDGRASTWTDSFFDLE